MWFLHKKELFIEPSTVASRNFRERAVWQKAGWAHAWALTAVKVKARVCPAVWSHFALPSGEETDQGSWPSGEKLWFVGNSGAFCCCCCLVLPLRRFLFVVFWLVLLFKKWCLSLDWWLTCQRRPSKVTTAALDTEVKVLGFTCLYYHLISFLVIAAVILAFAVMVTSSILNDIAMPLADNQVFSFWMPSHA